MPYEIESGIPVPTQGPGGHVKYPFRTMEIGDSFLVSDTKDPKVRFAASYFSARNREYRFIVRKQEGGFRVWRIAVNGELK